MLSALQLRFAVFLAIFCVAQAEILAHRHVDIPENPLTDHGFGGIHPRCSWNCTVIGMDIAEGRKNIIFKNRLISFVVQYELKVVDECVNQTLYRGTQRLFSVNICSKKQMLPRNFDSSRIAKNF